MISIGARYIGDHQTAATWFAASFTDEAEAVDRALELMRTVVPELRRMVRTALADNHIRMRFPG